MTKITDNITLRAYIKKQLEPHKDKTALDIDIERVKIIHAIADVCGLKPITIQVGGVINAGRYALIQSAIDDGRLPV